MLLMKKVMMMMMMMIDNCGRGWFVVIIQQGSICKKYMDS